MAFVGLSVSGNLSELTDAAEAWSALGTDVTLNVSGVTTAVTVTAEDIFALRGIHELSSREVLSARGLIANAQSQVTQSVEIAQATAALATNRLSKQSPVSSGNYFIAATLSGQSLKVNGTEVASLSSSPLSGNTFTSVVVVSQFAPIGWRVSEVMPSGAISNPEYALPIENANLFLYAKTGAS
jgi:hypothetical protein